MLNTPIWDHDDIFHDNVESSNWMTLIINYLTNDVWPNDAIEGRKLQQQASFYTMYNDELFLQGFSLSLLKCLDD